MSSQSTAEFAEVFCKIREQAILDVATWIGWLEKDEAFRESQGAQSAPHWEEFLETPEEYLIRHAEDLAYNFEVEMEHLGAPDDLPPILYAVIDEDGEILSQYGNPILFKKLSLAEKCQDDAKEWNSETLTIVEYALKGPVRSREEK